MKKWLNTVFESSSEKTTQFKNFARDFKKEVKSLLGPDYKVDLGVGHFFISGFAEKNGKYVYISVPDVRYARNEWSSNIMVRTAKHDKDYTGGVNNYTTLANLHSAVERLSK